MTVYYYSDNPNKHPTFSLRGVRFSIDRPGVTIMAKGMGGDSLGHWHFAHDGKPDVPAPPSDKPPYRVPSMAEIDRMRWNGFSVATTFAGCGGSSTGYRMAGFRVVWANEFVPAALESYKLNMRRGTVVDGRDIREVRGADVLEATGLAVGELDVFDGSPPCQAFSTAGKRERGWGTERQYEHGARQRNEDLFFEFCRLRDELMPRAFVAENVSGLIKGTAKGYFLDILGRLKKGYRVEARLLDAQWLGVPQARQRVIFIGVRDDLGLEPAFPKPMPYRYSVRDALPWLTADQVRYDTRGTFNGAVRENVAHKPSPTVTGHNPHHFIVQNKNAPHGRKGERKSVDGPAPTVMSRRANLEVERAATDIGPYAIGEEYDRLNPGQQSSKYFSLVRASASAPSPTITATGGQSPGVAGVVHPTEKRKFTIAEVRRLCAFPDDFRLAGTFGQQWERLGNSVPPLMMRAVAETLLERVLRPAAAKSARPARRSPARSTSGRSPRGAARQRPGRSTRNAANA